MLDPTTTLCSAPPPHRSTRVCELFLRPRGHCMMFTTPTVVFVLCLLASFCDASDHGRVMIPLGHRQDDAPLTFANSWEVLGPFQIGTRGMPSDRLLTRHREADDA